MHVTNNTDAREGAQQPESVPLNIVNIDDVAAFSECFASRVARDEAKTWFRSNLRNWVVRQRDLFMDVTAEEVVSLLALDGLNSCPNWIRAAAALNKALHWFDADAAPAMGGERIAQRLHEVADWLQSLPEEDRRWRAMPRMSVDAALSATAMWRVHAMRDATSEWPEDWSSLETVASFDDGVFAVRLRSLANLMREGRLMRHCVAGYAGLVETDETRIYSIRDRANQPHVTIEVTDGCVKQVKAKANAAPSAKWRDYVSRLIRLQDWQVGRWSTQFAMGGRFYADTQEIFADLGRFAPIPAAVYNHSLILRVIRRFVAYGRGAGVRLRVAEQHALLDALAPSMLAGGGFRVVQEPALQLPGAPMRRYSVSIAGAVFVLAEMGLLNDVLPRVRDLCAKVAGSVLLFLAAHDDDLCVLNLSRTLADENAVRRFFVAAGFGEDFHRMRSAALERKRENLRSSVVALRQRIASRQKTGALKSGESARALQAMRVQAPYFCERALARADAV